MHETRWRLDDVEGQSCRTADEQLEKAALRRRSAPVLSAVCDLASYPTKRQRALQAGEIVVRRRLKLIDCVA
jgi:hypothetical protein